MNSAFRMVSPVFPILAGVLLAGCATQSQNSIAATKSGWRSEASLCRDVDPNTADAIPPTSIAAVKPLFTTVHSGKDGAQERLLGAKLIVRAEPGMTPELLDRALECHVARHIAQRAPLAQDDPFDSDVQPLQISVKSAGPEFEVDIEAPNAAEAREVLARAKLLKTRVVVSVSAVSPPQVTSAPPSQL
jgi:hypothetical protein